MSIDVNLIFPQSAVATTDKKNEMVFHEGETTKFYYQIIEGGVILYNSNITANEFTQDLFCTGERFDESPLLINETYPRNTVTILDSDILKLSKKDFLKILEDYPPIQKYFLLLLAKRIW
jgi:CRP-like cAMP-binding protein